MNLGKLIVILMIAVLAVALLAVVILLLRKRTGKPDEQYDDSFEDTVDLSENVIKISKVNKADYSRIDILEDVVVTHYRK